MFSVERQAQKGEQLTRLPLKHFIKLARWSKGALYTPGGRLAFMDLKTYPKNVVTFDCLLPTVTTRSEKT